MRQTQTRGSVETSARLHRLGIDIVMSHLRSRGITPVSMTADEKYDPQIIAIDGDQRVHYAVRTAWLPDLGRLECDELLRELLEWARRDGAQCYLASVGIAPAHHGGTDAYRLVIWPLSDARLSDGKASA